MNDFLSEKLEERICVTQEDLEEFAAKFRRVDFLSGTVTGEKSEFVVEIGRIFVFRWFHMGAIHAYVARRMVPPGEIGDLSPFWAIYPVNLGESISSIAGRSYSPRAHYPPSERQGH